MSVPEQDDLRASFERYDRDVRQSRASALQARARIERAKAAVEEVRNVLLRRQRRAAKRAAKRERRRS